jgi:hypothetical protein
MYQQLWGYKVEDKLYLGVREQKWLNTTDLGLPTSEEKNSRRRAFDLLPPFLKRPKQYLETEGAVRHI